MQPLRLVGGFCLLELLPLVQTELDSLTLAVSRSAKKSLLAPLEIFFLWYYIIYYRTSNGACIKAGQVI